MRWLVLALSVTFSLLHTTSLVAQAEPRVTPLSLCDASGRLQRVFPAAEGQTTVVVFVSTGCPIANSYAPTWLSLAKELAGQPVRFFAVHANDEAREKAAANALEYGIPLPVLLDPERRAARMLEQQIRLPAGTRVRLEAQHDDSAANPRNPSTPPRLARRGEKTSDEMCIVFVGMVLPDLPELDLSALRGGRRRGR